MSFKTESRQRNREEERKRRNYVQSELSSLPECMVVHRELHLDRSDGNTLVEGRVPSACSEDAEHWQ